jgi:hypothetical protein
VKHQAVFRLPACKALPMITRLRHIAVVQFALVAAVLYALIGVLIGLAWWLIISPIMMAGIKTSGITTPGIAAMTGIGFFAILVFPIMYGVIGFIAGLLYAALYNLAARWTGGFELTLDQVPSTALPVRTV